MTPKVSVLALDAMPAALSRLLQQADLRLGNEIESADVTLLYANAWNRNTFGKLQSELRGGTAPVLVICERAEEPFSRDSLQRGDIAGLISANLTAAQFQSAIAAVCAGLIVRQPSNTSMRQLDFDATLTPRELEILRLMADGEGNKTIASILQISEHTVKFHISSIFQKLQAFSRTEAVRTGITLGLISI